MINIGNKFIGAEQIEVSQGKPVFAIVNKRSNGSIAQIGWYPAWRTYVLYPLENSVFDTGCLESILKFMRGLEIAERDE